MPAELIAFLDWIDRGEAPYEAAAFIAAILIMLVALILFSPSGRQRGR